MKFLLDLFPVVLFFVAYKIWDIYAATALAIAASLAQVAWQRWRHGRIETMHWATLGLLIVFGGLTIALRDPLFIKWKPTIVNAVFAAAFLGSQLFARRTLLERMMGHAVELPAVVWTRLNLAWSLFFIGLGILNVYVAYNFSEATWVNFKLFGLMGLTLAFVVAQSFYMARHIRDQQPAED